MIQVVVPSGAEFAFLVDNLPFGCCRAAAKVNDICLATDQTRFRGIGRI